MKYIKLFEDVEDTSLSEIKDVFVDVEDLVSTFKVEGRGFKDRHPNWYLIKFEHILESSSDSIEDIKKRQSLINDIINETYDALRMLKSMGYNAELVEINTESVITGPPNRIDSNKIIVSGRIDLLKK